MRHPFKSPGPISPHTITPALAAFLVALVLAPAAHGDGADRQSDRWTTVAEEGLWSLDDDRQLDLSGDWRVIRHVATGRERIVPKALGGGGGGGSDSNWTIELLPFSAFVPRTSTGISWTTSFSTGYGWQAGGTPDFMWAPLQVESGLRVRQIELEACHDNTSPSNLFVILYRCEVFTDDCEFLTDHQVFALQNGGCTLRSVFPDPGETIDNRDFTYYVFAHDGLGTDTTRFRSVRLYLQRQVSPAPTTATFGDVPTGHQFFRHIEALAASEVTGGCGGGNYCPDAPLTRGQMAVFLAKALGLHWSF